MVKSKGLGLLLSVIITFVFLVIMSYFSGKLIDILGIGWYLGSGVLMIIVLAFLFVKINGNNLEIQGNKDSVLIILLGMGVIVWLFLPYLILIPFVTPSPPPFWPRAIGALATLVVAYVLLKKVNSNPKK